MSPLQDLAALAKLVRYHILTSTTEAGSGHPTSSLSATDLMTTLFFRYLRADLDHPEEANNDRVIFSKGHAAPLLYALYATAGMIKPSEMLQLRKLGSPLEGHPTPGFRYAEAATGSLGQGLSIGIGFALNAKKLDQLPARTFVLLGDGEMAEGSVWEAIQLAAHYRLNNLIGILDVNRMGQSGETLYGHNLEAYAAPIRAFGWHVITIDGHSLPEIDKAFQEALAIKDRPIMIVAKTFKGAGISFLQDKEGWHGKPLSKTDLEKALKELGPLNPADTGTVARPEKTKPATPKNQEVARPHYPLGQEIATRKAYGESLTYLASKYPTVVALDGDVKNST
ncbi:MAG: 1-deoxy-D-xylulose-5-phosphate synthase N-terminal domain-containing protein, partial [Deltaproteobacteria bacterium]|nr:1-deoxy-D-xylulose-5-phosphate synthase N-terminal domain-containing protein [Deltaproteobacteria bacterium]